MGHLWTQQILHEIYFDLSLFKHNKQLPPQREISCWKWCACSCCTPVCMISSCSSIDKNVMALHCFARDPFEMDKWLMLCHRAHWPSLSSLFFFQFLLYWYSPPILSHPPSFVHVFSLFNVLLMFFILDYFYPSFSHVSHYFMFLCPIFSPLAHLQRLS